MRVRVLGAYGGSTPWHRQTSFLLDGTVSLDAGALTQSLTLEEQSRVRSIIVTHSHLDHIASLPFLVENVFGRTEGPIEVVGPKDVAALLQDHLFNDAIWPDFTRIPTHLLPAVTFRVDRGRRAVPRERPPRARGPRLPRRPDVRLPPLGRPLLRRLLERHRARPRRSGPRRAPGPT